jgi:atypical dual specificity phosphatase
MFEMQRTARIWWIARGQLAGSRNPTQQELRVLKFDGFSTIVSLLDESQQQPSYSLSSVKEIGYEWRSMPIADHCAPTLDQMLEFARVVDEQSTIGKVLVHCWAGLGRTGTMGAAYLICRGQTAAAAINSIRRVCPYAIENQEQEASLLTLEKVLKESPRTGGSPVVHPDNPPETS